MLCTSHVLVLALVAAAALGGADALVVDKQGQAILPDKTPTVAGAVVHSGRDLGGDVGAPSSAKKQQVAEDNFWNHVNEPVADTGVIQASTLGLGLGMGIGAGIGRGAFGATLKPTVIGITVGGVVGAGVGGSIAHQLIENTKPEHVANAVLKAPGNAVNGAIDIKNAVKTDVGGLAKDIYSPDIVKNSGPLVHNVCVDICKEMGLYPKCEHCPDFESPVTLPEWGTGELNAWEKQFDADAALKAAGQIKSKAGQLPEIDDPVLKIPLEKKRGLEKEAKAELKGKADKR